MGDLRRAAWPRTVFCVLISAICATSLWADPVSAEPRKRYEQLGTTGVRMNSNTVYVISGNLNATYISIAYDLSAVLDDGDNLRVLPVIGKGGGQNIRDVRFLRGVDIGITQSNLLGMFKRTNEIGPIDDKILYIARLFNEEMHVIVRAESGITSIEQLSGKTVNFSDVGSGTQLSTRDVMERLGIKALEVNMGQNDAFEALKKGEIDATVLIAYNWAPDTDRYRRIARFIDAFFPRLAEFQKPPRHPKWKEANLAATVPGWKRFPAAEEWLRQRREAQQPAAPPTSRVRFEQFLARNGENNATAFASEQQRDQLFEQFLKWNRTQEGR